MKLRGSSKENKIKTQLYTKRIGLFLLTLITIAHFSLPSHAQMAPLDQLKVVKRVGDYDLVRIPTKKVDQYMQYLPDDENIPEVLRGLWWMDGNPQPDDVISFATAKFNDDPWDPYYDVSVYGEKVWSWYDDQRGIGAFENAHNVGLEYRIRLPNEREMDITPMFGGFPVPWPFNKVFLHFKAHQIGNDVDNWIRDSYIFGANAHNYNLRRIVDKDGRKIKKNFDLFIEKTKSRPTILMAIKRRGL